MSVGHYILNKSKLYDEIKDMSGTDAGIIPLITNNVIKELNEIDLSVSDLFQYTRAIRNKYINYHLELFSLKELKDAYELLEFWQLPKDWATAVAEEVAFKEFLIIWEGVDKKDPDCLPYDYLPAILRQKADEICGRVCDESGPIDSCLVFIQSSEDPLVEYLFGRSDSNVEEQYEEWYPLQEIMDEIIISSGYIDLLDILLTSRFMTEEKTAKYALIAVDCGHLDVLKDIHYRHLYWNWEKSLFRAYTRRQKHIVEWIMSISKKELPKKKTKY